MESNSSSGYLADNSSSGDLPDNSNSEMGYYNEAFHFTATPTDAPLHNGTQENVNETVIDSPRKKNVFKRMKSFLKKVLPAPGNRSNERRYREKGSGNDGGGKGRNGREEGSDEKSRAGEK
ncbi:hypothetical protein TNCV_2070451 [Trichonephila clavipes]|uniref:Uncharacterized protein n=1 Tax=Trichonephila clavipes TaxID=2585209 RepID=A0A8X6W350_TRICX|nr:hypothetical protein TNCV_2070451 [Trichonephila clavipes]